MLLQQKPAKVEIDKLIAHITFDVHLEDLERYYKDGFIFVERRD